jgi:predicted SAM-dependent methyltransferase
MSAAETTLKESFALARLLRQERGYQSRLARIYWKGCWHATRILERMLPWPPAIVKNKSVMNYGCGNKFYPGAINVDLFAPHRALLGKRRPDMYWSGTTRLSDLQGSLDGIVCEHVIEHILPDDVQGLLLRFRELLKPGGVLVVSFPDVGKVLDGGLCQGFNSLTASVNSLIYRHGHCFMYDCELVTGLLRRAGFTEVASTPFENLPFKEFIGSGRAAETSYVVARCAAASAGSSV